MSSLAPKLFTRRFDDLIQIGRARLPPLAPAWTDHNAHDPGITLMELLAWVTEAQLYSVTRMRRDERAAYARLMGVQSAGTQSSRGLIWPDRLDPNTPVATFSRTVVIGKDAAVHVIGDEALTFRPTEDVLWIPGRIERLETRNAAGPTTDLTRINERGGPAFNPFGESSGRGVTLAMTFACRDDAGLFGRDRRQTKDAVWTIGILAAPPAAGAPADASAEPGSRRSPLAVTFVGNGVRVPVSIVSDSSQGMLTTGAIVLNLDAVRSAFATSKTSPRTFTLEFRLPKGIARPSRILRIEPNVLPIRQGRFIDREVHVATGLPDWSLDLDVPGLRFSAGELPVRVEISETTGLSTWHAGSLSEAGPEDAVFELEAAKGRLTFGNGINGRIPAVISQVLVSYAVSDAETGNLGRNRKWAVQGFGGTFGVNIDPITGGAAPLGWVDERREARRRIETDHALVSDTDIVGAALNLALLEVARAWVVAPDIRTPRSGVVMLIAMRGRAGDVEPERPPETLQWLDAIRRRLASRMPLGARLAVHAPRYVDFTIHASIETEPGRDPSTVKNRIVSTLRRRLALVASAAVPEPREPGIPVTERDVAAWIRKVDGVGRIVSLELRDARGTRQDAIGDTRRALPRWVADDASIAVGRPRQGAANAR